MRKHWFVATILLTASGLTLAAVLRFALAPAGSGSTAPSEQIEEPQEGLAERDRLYSEAITRQTAGEHAEALALYGKTLAIERAVLGDNHEDVVATLRRMAELHALLDDFENARKTVQEALDIQSKLSDAKPWQITDARQNLHWVEEVSQMDSVRRRELAESGRLRDQMIVLYVKGKYRDGIKLAQQVREFSQQTLGEKHPDFAVSLNNLGVFYHCLGDYGRAEPLYREALDIFKDVLGEEHPDYVTTFNNLAVIYGLKSDYGRALPLYRRALELRKAVVGEKHPDYARSVNNLAWLHKSIGDFANAEPLYQKALHLHEQGLSYGRPNGRILEIFRHVDLRRPPAAAEMQTDLALIVGNLALCYYELGDYARAEPLFHKALDINKKTLGEHSEVYARNLNNLAALYQLLGDYPQAETLFQKAADLRKETLGENHPDYAMSLHNLGRFYRLIENYDRAEPFFRQALAIRKQTIGEKHLYYAASLDNLAAVCQARGDYVQAELLFGQALAISEQLLHQTAGAQSERQQLDMAADLRHRLDSYLCCTLATRATGKLDPEATAELYRHVLAWKGAILARQRLQRLARTHSELAPLFTKLQSVSRRLATYALAVPDSRQREAWRREVADLSEAKERLEGELASRYAAFAGAQPLAQLTAEELQAALPSDAALLDMLEYSHSQPDPRQKGKLLWEQRLATFVLRRGRVPVLIDLGPVRPLAEAIERWRTRDRRGDDLVATDLAGELRRRLWQPLAAPVGDASLLLVSPDGVLGTFPFGALPGQKLGSFLLEERLVAVVPVPQLLPELLRDLTPAGNEESRKGVDGVSLLLVGDIDFEAPGGKAEAGLLLRAAARERQGEVGAFGPLEGTRAEVMAIKDSFLRRFRKGMVSELRKGEATEGTVRMQTPRHRYLHFATHGFFAPPSLKSALRPGEQKGPGSARPVYEGGLGRRAVRGYHPGLLSGLVLAGANRAPQPGEDDGILTALEVAEMDLTRVELAVLSACETGLGEVAGGEGLLGLQRAFQMAGAKSVVASLWQVPDKATQLLMQRFYDNFWNKQMGRLAALREAQLWLLREGAERLGRMRGGLVRPGPKPNGPLPPFYWAAFVLSGDWR